MSDINQLHRKTYVEIDTSVIAKNVRDIIQGYPGYQYYIGVVKGNAYGHGFEIVKTLVTSGVNYLAVSDLDEALEVRQIDSQVPILCLEPIDLKFIDLCAANKITITVSNYDYYIQLTKKKLPGIKFHIKLNTGMNRLGISDKTRLEEIFDNSIHKNSGLELEGIYTHFATTGALDKLYDEQLARFEYLTSNIDLSKIKIIHLGRSVTLELHDKIPLANGVRLGIIMYGINQTPRDYSGIKGSLRQIKDRRTVAKLGISATRREGTVKVTPGLALKTTVVEINKVKSGSSINYGATYRTTKNSFIAVCPIGYADGLDLRYNRCSVSINDRSYPIVGVVNMNMLTIEVDQHVKVGDTVTIIGDKISVKNIARRIDSTPYVVMAAIAKEIPRFYE
ncbi:alanine racemase [Candidatus Saccharibacteria bacterium]|nr:alanine racemase [Candidatus Saccharibacteria bacterium]